MRLSELFTAYFAITVRQRISNSLLTEIFSRHQKVAYIYFMGRAQGGQNATSLTRRNSTQARPKFERQQLPTTSVADDPYLSQLRQDQRDVLAIGFSSSFTWSAVIAPGTEAEHLKSLGPTLYLISDLPNAEPRFVGPLGHVGGAEQMPDGEQFIVRNDAFDLPMDLSGQQTREQLLLAMRQWLENSFEDVPEDLTDHEVVQSVKQHHERGVAAFIRPRQ
jgi:hypothetical protein